MSESRMRSNVIRALRPLHAIAVENAACPGTPDVNYVEGWIELKQLPRWPKGVDTIVRMPTFTRQQRLFLEERWRAGGDTYLLLQVGREWLLFDGWTAARKVGSTTRDELREAALRIWPNLSSMREVLVWCLSR